MSVQEWPLAIAPAQLEKTQEPARAFPKQAMALERATAPELELVLQSPARVESLWPELQVTFQETMMALAAKQELTLRVHQSYWKFPELLQACFRETT